MTNGLGKWRPGQSGNPKGRPRGQSEVARFRLAIEQHVSDIVDRLVILAKSGDVQAARLLLERVLPPLKATEPTVAVSLPLNGTLTDKGQAMLAAAAEGLISPGQAAALVSVVAGIAKVKEVDELAARVEALEKKS